MNQGPPSGAGPKGLRDIIASLEIPVVAAPMTAVSGPELVAAACTSGIIGSFPAHNARSHAELDEWLSQIEEERQAAIAARPSAGIGPIALNLVMRLKSRLDGDVEAALRHRIPLVIANVGSPAEIIPPLHAAGVHVLADVASLRHAEKALEAGADGLVLLTAGAGGNTGWVNPFAFVRAVRAMYDGPLVLAGGAADGFALRSAIVLGCDAAFVGTRFIATVESRADAQYKRALVKASLDQVAAIAGPDGGLTANFIREKQWSAGHSVSSVREITTVRQLVAQLRHEWDAAGSAAKR